MIPDFMLGKGAMAPPMAGVQKKKKKNGKEGRKMIPRKKRSKRSKHLKVMLFICGTEAIMTGKDNSGQSSFTLSISVY